ncbi:hypothetical protein, partial [Streptomyces misionensis]|uniref:hypothetical protein n=1 Tax=Streptomyces misionensis TaxID=67331 RepID=UPI0036AE7B06
MLIRMLLRFLVQAVRAGRALYRRLRPDESVEEAPTKEEKAEEKKELAAAKKPTLVKVARKGRRKSSGKGKPK